MTRCSATRLLRTESLANGLGTRRVMEQQVRRKAQQFTPGAAKVLGQSGSCVWSYRIVQWTLNSPLAQSKPIGACSVGGNRGHLEAPHMPSHLMKRLDLRSTIAPRLEQRASPARADASRAASYQRGRTDNADGAWTVWTRPDIGAPD